MEEMEALLQRARSGPLPRVPDARYTAAAVRRRVQPPPSAPPAVDWLLLLGALGTVAGGAALLWALGISLWWLTALPTLALPLLPTLLRKGA